MSTETPLSGTCVLPTYPQRSPTKIQRGWQKRLGETITLTLAGRTIDATLLAVEPDFSAIAPDFRLHVETDAGELGVSPSEVVKTGR